MGEEILQGIFNALITNFLTSVGIIDLISSIVDTGNVFSPESTFNSFYNVNIDEVTAAVFKIGYWFLILKFVWKGFNIYMLGVDGDEDSDPMILFFNFVKAIVISLGFGVLFSTFMLIAKNISDGILSAFHYECDFTMSIQSLAEICGAGLFLSIMCLVYIIMVIVLTLKFMKNAIELAILRIGICFAVSGLIDSDQGVYKPYIKKFFQISWTVILQVACFKLSVYALAGADIIPSIVAMAMALSAPAFLSEFIMTNQSHGKLQQAIFSINMLRSIAKK